MTRSDTYVDHSRHRLESQGYQQPRTARLVRYGVALASCVVALLLALLLAPLIDTNVLAIFFMAVMISAYVGGIGPALLAVALSTALCTFLFLPPQLSFVVRDLSTLVRLVVFVTAALLISTLTAARRRAEGQAAAQRERFEVTLASIGDAVIATDTAGTITFMNEMAERLTGWRSAEAIGRDLDAVFRVVEHGSRQVVDPPVARVLRDGVVVGLANHTLLIARDGTEHPIDNSGAPIRDRAGAVRGAVLVFHDVSDRYQAEQARTALLARERQALRAAEAAQARLAFLAEASQQLMASLDYRVALQTIAQLATAQLADWVVADLAADDGSIARVLVATADPTKQPLADALSSFPADPDAPLGPGLVLRTGQSIFNPHVPVEELAQVARSPEHLAILEALGIGSTMLVPLQVRGQTIGVLTYTRFRGAPPFEAGDLALAEELARRAAQAIDNARLYAARQHIEAALRESEQRFRATFELAAVGIAHVAMNGQWQQVNQRLCEIVGYPCDELLARTFQDITHPDDLETDLSLVRQLIAGAIPSYSMEKRYVRKDGALTWVTLTVTLVRGAGGAPSFFISVVEDINARKQAEAERDRLLASERAARAAAETVAAQLQRLQAVTDTALAHLMLDDLLAELLGRICAILKADTAAILLRDPEDGMLVVRAARGLEEEVSADLRIPIGAGFAGRVAAERRVIALDRVNPSEIFSPILRQSKVASLLGAPLLVAGELIGVVHVGMLQPRQFKDEESQLLQLVADRIALAVAQAQRYEAQQRSAQRLRALHEIDLAILQAEAPDRLAGAALARMRNLVPYDYGVVTIASAGTERVLAEYGRCSGAPVPLALQASGAPARLATTAEGRPGLPGGSTIAMPLAANGEAIGQIQLFAHEPARFGREHAEIAGEVSSQLAIALQQAHFRAALQQANAELEHRVLERTTELQAVVDDLNAFSYTISHDLRAPLRSLQGFGTALLEDYGELLPPQGQTYLKYMVAAGAQMDQLVQDLLSYNQLSRADLRLDPVDLDAVVAGARQQLADLIAESGADLSAGESLPPVRGHYATLVQVVANLIANAIKFVAPGDRPRVHVGAEQLGDRVRLTVTDRGIGIAPADQARIFNVFERLHGAETYPGTGIGLAIVRKAVERMGGRAGVDSLPGQGSRFWIELPAEEL